MYHPKSEDKKKRGGGWGDDKAYFAPYIGTYLLNKASKTT